MQGAEKMSRPQISWVNKGEAYPKNAKSKRQFHVSFEAELESANCGTTRQAWKNKISGGWKRTTDNQRKLREEHCQQKIEMDRGVKWQANNKLWACQSIGRRIGFGTQLGITKLENDKQYDCCPKIKNTTRLNLSPILRSVPKVPKFSAALELNYWTGISYFKSSYTSDMVRATPCQCI